MIYSQMFNNDNNKINIFLFIVCLCDVTSRYIFIFLVCQELQEERRKAPLYTTGISQIASEQRWKLGCVIIVWCW